MSATAILTEPQARPWVPADLPAADISLCQTVPSTVDPAFGDDEQLPCRALDADLWFADSPGDLERAKAYCQGCPVRAGCLAGALDRREPWGVWGGEIFSGGSVIARKRPRGRPRKNEVAA
jgi:WhiB family redox-sensing transcriptional regulator